MDYETSKPGAIPQAMLSVAGLEEDKVASICKGIASKTGSVCQIANYLFPKGFSCAGEQSALQELETQVKAANALQAKFVKTSGAFHTPLMAAAREAARDEGSYAAPKV